MKTRHRTSTSDKKHALKTPVTLHGFILQMQKALAAVFQPQGGMPIGLPQCSTRKHARCDFLTVGVALQAMDHGKNMAMTFFDHLAQTCGCSLWFLGPELEFDVGQKMQGV